jgi:hypothetical protein
MKVIFEEQQGKLYYIQYIIEGSDDFLTIATTRPETILVTRPFVLILMMNVLHLREKKPLFLFVVV